MVWGTDVYNGEEYFSCGAQTNVEGKFFGALRRNLLKVQENVQRTFRQTAVLKLILLKG